MKRNLLLLLNILFAAGVSAQDFKGQWKGEFIDKSTSYINWGGDKCDYVLELETAGSSVKGFSYTYFTDGGKKYYTICRLQGFIDKKNKYIEVKEVERTKTNVPNNIRNCFQTHKLTYFKEGNSETLEGNWVPAPNQDGDCGYGFTNLTRRVLVTNIPNTNNTVAKTIQPKRSTTTTFRDLRDKNKITSPVAKQPAKPKEKDIVLMPQKGIAQKDPVDVSPPIVTNSIQQEKIKLPVPEFKKRNFNVLKTIEVGNETVQVDLYDNGEIDGDSISLFYNGKLLVSKKMLTAKALTFTLPVDKAMDVNELVMYAENLGSIPPNTALMVVKDGNRRYEVRITSDLQKSGVIQFVHESRSKAAAN
jgi:hypothetical protein